MDIKEEHRKFYEKMQEQSNLKVGDKVKITRIAKDYEYGWNNVWESPGMDKSVGCTSTIKNINKYNGVLLDIDWYRYPFFVLEKVKEKEYDIKSCYLCDNKLHWIQTHLSLKDILDKGYIKEIFKSGNTTIYGSTISCKLYKVTEL